MHKSDTVFKEPFIVLDDLAFDFVAGNSKNKSTAHIVRNLYLLDRRDNKVFRKDGKKWIWVKPRKIEGWSANFWPMKLMSGTVNTQSGHYTNNKKEREVTLKQITDKLMETMYAGAFWDKKLVREPPYKEDEYSESEPPEPEPPKKPILSEKPTRIPVKPVELEDIDSLEEEPEEEEPPPPRPPPPRPPSVMPPNSVLENKQRLDLNPNKDRFIQLNNYHFAARDEQNKVVEDSLVVNDKYLFSLERDKLLEHEDGSNYRIIPPDMFGRIEVSVSDIHDRVFKVSVNERELAADIKSRQLLRRVSFPQINILDPVVPDSPPPPSQPSPKHKIIRQAAEMQDRDRGFNGPAFQARRGSLPDISPRKQSKPKQFETPTRDDFSEPEPEPAPAGFQTKPQKQSFSRTEMSRPQPKTYKVHQNFSSDDEPYEPRFKPPDFSNEGVEADDTELSYLNFDDGEEAADAGTAQSRKASKNLFTKTTFPAEGKHKQFDGFASPGLAQLSDIVAGLYKDVKLMKGLTTIRGASKYVSQHNKGSKAKWTAHEDDIIGQDGVPEVFITDQNGRINTINGYRLVKSQNPYIKAYNSKFPTNEAKAKFRQHSIVKDAEGKPMGGYRAFKKYMSMHGLDEKGNPEYARGWDLVGKQFEKLNLKRPKSYGARQLFKQMYINPLWNGNEEQGAKGAKTYIRENFDVHKIVDGVDMKGAGMLIIYQQLFNLMWVFCVANYALEQIGYNQEKWKTIRKDDKVAILKSKAFQNAAHDRVLGMDKDNGLMTWLDNPGSILKVVNSAIDAAGGKGVQVERKQAEPRPE